MVLGAVFGGRRCRFGASGFLSDLMSYRIFFLAVMLATIPAFVITRLVPFTYDDKPNDK